MGEAEINKLKTISFFAGMSEHDLRQIDDITEEKHYKRGEVIIEENSQADCFFIIHTGKIEIVKKMEEGEELVLGVHSSDEFFGEMALLDEGKRSATARALEETAVFKISRPNFETLLYQSPVLAYTIMKELSARLRETGALLVSYLRRKNRQLSTTFLETTKMVVHAVESRDAYSKGHTRRVTDLSKAIGVKMVLPEEELFMLEIGALLHDLGQIEMADTTYLKPGPLEQDEYETIQKHPQRGKELMETIPYLEKAIPSVLHHHERFDGGGYPNHLTGSGIPLAGRIISVADAYDAMTSARPYRKTVSSEQAVAEIKRCAGAQFDPEVVKAFLAVYKTV